MEILLLIRIVVVNVVESRVSFHRCSRCRKPLSVCVQVTNLLELLFNIGHNMMLNGIGYFYCEKTWDFHFACNSDS